MNDETERKAVFPDHYCDREREGLLPQRRAKLVNGFFDQVSVMT